MAVSSALTGDDTSITKCDKAPDEIVEAMKSVSTEKEKSYLNSPKSDSDRTSK